MSIKENQKFRRKEDEDLSNTPKDLKDFVSDIKERFGLKYSPKTAPLLLSYC